METCRSDRMLETMYALLTWTDRGYPTGCGVMGQVLVMGQSSEGVGGGPDASLRWVVHHGDNTVSRRSDNQLLLEPILPLIIFREHRKSSIPRVSLIPTDTDFGRPHVTREKNPFPQSRRHGTIIS